MKTETLKYRINQLKKSGRNILASDVAEILSGIIDAIPEEGGGGDEGNEMYTITLDDGGTLTNDPGEVKEAVSTGKMLKLVSLASGFETNCFYTIDYTQGDVLTLYWSENSGTSFRKLVIG